ncbi:MAG: cytochrome b N-terminal domain-containing protein [Chloroflexi bacterium]|nr:cytochrome b N-terminal domain-containing protein [Chloroflexota bacterium]
MRVKKEGWLEERVNLEPIRASLLDRKIPKGVGWLQTLGSATLITFVALVVTGVMLTMNYSNSPDHAYDSVQYIENEVTYGWLIRGVHHWAASGMVVLAVLHGLRTLFSGAYKYPRELTWIVGVLLLLLVMGAAFTGYLLPWDQKAYWATVVGTNIAGEVPVVGGFVLKLLRGGESIGAVTLVRFYSLHAAIIPILITTLISIHLFLVVRIGIAAPQRRGKTHSAVESR